MSLLEMSLSGGVMAAAVVLIRALAIDKLPKRTFLVLWGVVLARLLVPFSLPSPLSFYRLFPPKTAPVILQSATAPANFSPPQTLPAPAALPAAASAAPAVDLRVLVWVGGALLLLLIFVLSYRKWYGIFRTSLPADNEFTRRWLGSHPLRRRIRVRQSDRIAAPLTYGLLRPVILVPGALDWTDETTLQYVFAHEYVHICRFHAAYKLLLAGALCLHWFNPLVWVTYLLANRDMELSCDEAVVRRFGGKSRLDYVMALLAMEEQKSGLMHLNFSKNAIQERITSIMKIKKLTITAVLTACLVVAAATAAFATTAPEAEPVLQATAADNSWNIHCADGKIWFTVPEGSWTVNLAGRVEAEDMGGMSVHYEFPELKSGGTYSYDVSGGGYTELWMNITSPDEPEAYRNLDLMGCLPERLKHISYEIYEPFGLIYDDKLYFKGEKVRYFYDGVELEDGAAVRREYLCDSGTVDVYTVWEPKDNGDGSYDPFGTLIDVRAYSQEEFDNRVIPTDGNTIQEATATTYGQPLQEGKTFEEIFAPYEAFGVTYAEAPNASGAGNVYYNGQLVKTFVDLSETGTFSYQSRTQGGTINLRTVYDSAGRLTGVEEFSEEGLLLEGGLVWPVSGQTQLTQLFGTRKHPITGRETLHAGVDVTAPEDTPVLATAAGTVAEAGFDSKYGNYVLLSHGNGLETFYAHLAACSVRAGDAAAQGQAIGTVGSSGQATGPHLHFEVRQDGTAVDPQAYF